MKASSLFAPLIFSAASWFGDHEVVSAAAATSGSLFPATASHWIHMPPGCTCRDIRRDTSSTECEAFDCTCNCDLTATVCDYNCCCDADCEEEEKKRFSDPQQCSAGAIASSQPLRMCYERQDAIQLEKINARYPLRLDDTVEVRESRNYTVA